MREKSKGLTLTEILISIALIATTIIIMIQIFISGLEAIQKGNKYTLATNLAKDKMEKVRELDYSKINFTDSPWLQDEVKNALIIDTNISSENIYPGANNIKYKIVTIEVYSPPSADRRKSVNVKLESVCSELYSL